MTEQSKINRRMRWALVVMLSLTIGVVTCCCFAPGFGLGLRPAVDVNTFNVKSGATMDEVRANYGSPSNVHSEPDGKVIWQYYTDKLGLGFTMVGVRFDATGHVEFSWNY